MDALLHSPLFDAIRGYLIERDSRDGTIFVFSPYIRTKVLGRLLKDIRSRIVVVTTWHPADILSGSSCTDLYLSAVPLYVSETLHLKYSVGLESAILAIRSLILLVNCN